MHMDQKSKQELRSWIFPILMLIFVTPLGVLLVVLKLLGGGGLSRGQRREQRTQGYAAQSATRSPLGARTTGGQGGQTVSPAAAPQVSQQIARLAKKGKQLALLGGGLSVVTVLALAVSMRNVMYWLIHGEFAWFLDDLLAQLPALCVLAVGLGLLVDGIRRQRRAGRFRGYLAMIGEKKSVAISALASATGRPKNKVCADLEDMLDAGLFPSGYLNYGGDRFVLGGGLEDQPESQATAPAAKAQPQPSKADRGAENAILDEIRQVNDQVANEKLSAQIDRIGVITAKILEYQKSRPEKAPQLHSFLSYYLPTTLKILRAYGQLESQQIAGENITAAMARVEGMMDKVVEGFEKQLDQLFQGDTMDITADVDVLEQMLARDGLTGEQLRL
ncbi:5-bromo-4-chloroindolyl phosphate hydrolysis family protein [Lawsonibacter sp. DFI.6.74]|nr:5-bromo-4-chloroindolyl phosphate hydrolysis family protein [Lawsonibacter sp. DFI.6.74]MCG4774858.1 5-bromo-4-chloroindolyl phosphate hydrolysis family protein [Lawsonibacter sp. DFI.5.51]